MRQAAMRVVSVLAVGTLASGCGLLGRAGGTRLGPATSITVTSPVTGPEATLPRAYTCRGAGISPPLYWSGVPEPQTKSLVIVIDDAQAPINPYIYWLVYNISPGTTSIPQGGRQGDRHLGRRQLLPVGARQGPNSTGRTGYAAPCPSGSHDMYRFTVYALNTRPDLAGDALRQAWWTIAQHVIASGRLTVRADA